MCMKSSAEGCILLGQQQELAGKVDSLDRRLTSVEADVRTIRAETQAGFTQGAESLRLINVAVTNLAHDFGERMNNLDKRVVAEKEKWGETLRWVVRVAVKVLLAGAVVAMGINAYNTYRSVVS